MAFFSKNKDDSSVDEKKSKKKSKNTELPMKTYDEDERLERGQIKTRLIIETAGNPKDLVEKTFEIVLTKLKDENEHYVIQIDKSEIKEQEKGLWTMYAEIEMWSKNFPALVAVLFEYFPSSVEILEPSHINFTAPVFSDYLNDVQTRLHNTDMVAKNLRLEIDYLKKQAGGMLNNLVLLALKNGPGTLDEISKQIGVPSKELEPYMAKFVEIGKFEKEEETYKLAAKK